MTTEDALAKLAACADTLRAAGVTALHLFGSVARGEAGPRSDLDIFIDHDPSRKFSLFDLVGIKLLVQDRLQVEADVTTRDGLHPMLRSEIERSAIRVF